MSGAFSRNHTSPSTSVHVHGLQQATAPTGDEPDRTNGDSRLGRTRGGMLKSPPLFNSRSHWTGVGPGAAAGQSWLMGGGGCTWVKEWLQGSAPHFCTATVKDDFFASHCSVEL